MHILLHSKICMIQIKHAKESIQFYFITDEFVFWQKHQILICDKKFLWWQRFQIYVLKLR